MYGSLLAIREQSKDGSALESLGFEICRDSALNKDDKYIWIFFVYNFKNEGKEL